MRRVWPYRTEPDRLLHERQLERHPEELCTSVSLDPLHGKGEFLQDMLTQEAHRRLRIPLRKKR